MPINALFSCRVNTIHRNLKPLNVRVVRPFDKRVNTIHRNLKLIPKGESVSAYDCTNTIHRSLKHIDNPIVQRFSQV